jgi:hypothetical protein
MSTVITNVVLVRVELIIGKIYIIIFAIPSPMIFHLKMLISKKKINIIWYLC